MLIREELKKYIENEIFEIYNKNEKGHGIEHLIKYLGGNKKCRLI